MWNPDNEDYFEIHEHMYWYLDDDCFEMEEEE